MSSDWMDNADLASEANNIVAAIHPQTWRKSSSHKRVVHAAYSLLETGISGVTIEKAIRDIVGAMKSEYGD